MPDPPVDPRGVRFAAAVTTAVLVLVLVSGSAWLLAAQVVVFALVWAVPTYLFARFRRRHARL